MILDAYQHLNTPQPVAVCPYQVGRTIPHGKDAWQKHTVQHTAHSEDYPSEPFGQSE